MNQSKKAQLTIAFCALLWSTGGLLIKWINMSPIAIAGARSGIAGLVMFLYLIHNSTKKNRKASSTLFTPTNNHQLIGAVVYAVMIISYVAANKMTTAANAILLQFTAPIWVALFSGWFLKEKVSRKDWIAVVITMMGILLFFKDNLEVGRILGSSLAVLSGICLAGVVILLKLDTSDSPVQMTFLGNMITFIICLPSLFLSNPNTLDLIYLIILGVFQLGISYILYNHAVKHVSAVEAILITIIEPLLNPIWVFLFTGESPGLFATLGGVIVLLTVLINGLRKQSEIKPLQNDLLSVDPQ